KQKTQKYEWERCKRKQCAETRCQKQSPRGPYEEEDEEEEESNFFKASDPSKAGTKSLSGMSVTNMVLFCVLAAKDRSRPRMLFLPRLVTHDDTFNSAFQYHLLRRNSTSPEDGHFSLLAADPVAEVDGLPLDLVGHTNSFCTVPAPC